MNLEPLTSQLRALLGFDLPKDETNVVAALHRHVYGPQGTFKREDRLASEEEQERYLLFVECCIASVGQAYRLAAFRRDQIALLEEKADSIIKELWPSTGIQAGAVTIGHSTRFDGEYQSFLFASRSCLDYYDRGIRAYLRQPEGDYDSFSTHRSALVSCSHAPSKILLQIHERHKESLAFALGRGSRRNRTAHREFLLGAHVVATERGLRLGGGSEKLSPECRLSDVLAERLRAVHAFVTEGYDALIRNDWPSIDDA
jgi:hypothetical protein